MPQLPYSPKLAPADCFSFKKLKTPMKRKRFATIEEMKEMSKQIKACVRCVSRIGGDHEKIDTGADGNTKKRFAAMFRGLEKPLAYMYYI